MILGPGLLPSHAYCWTGDAVGCCILRWDVLYLLPTVGTCGPSLSLAGYFSALFTGVEGSICALILSLPRPVGECKGSHPNRYLCPTRAAGCAIRATPSVDTPCRYPARTGTCICRGPGCGSGSMAYRISLLTCMLVCRLQTATAASAML